MLTLWKSRCWVVGFLVVLEAALAITIIWDVADLGFLVVLETAFAINITWDYYMASHETYVYVRMRWDAFARNIIFDDYMSSHETY